MKLNDIFERAVEKAIVYSIEAFNRAADKILDIPAVQSVLRATDNNLFDGAVIATGGLTYLGLKTGFIPANFDLVGVSMLTLSVAAPISSLIPFMNRIDTPPPSGPK